MWHSHPGGLSAAIKIWGNTSHIVRPLRPKIRSENRASLGNDESAPTLDNIEEKQPEEKEHTEKRISFLGDSPLCKLTNLLFPAPMFINRNSSDIGFTLQIYNIHRTNGKKYLIHYSQYTLRLCDVPVANLFNKADYSLCTTRWRNL